MPFPEFLCRHQPISANFERERQLFERNELYFGSAKDFNDPFDTRPHFEFSNDAGITLDQARRLVEKRFPDRSPEDREALAEAMRNKLNLPAVRADVRRQLIVGQREMFYSNSLKCFTPRWENLLQWAHYADRHKGYCVVFALPRLWIYRTDEGREQAIAVAAAIYADTYPTLDLDRDLDTREELQKVLDALLTKSKHWTYEEEWRALRVGAGPGVQSLPEGAIRAVVFGYRMSGDVRARLVEIVRRHATKIELFDALPAEDQFELRAFERPGEN